MKSQSGFAHVLIVIGLIALLIGALGIVLWKSLYSDQIINSPINKDKSTVSDEDRSVSESPVYNRSIPEGWKSTHEKPYYSLPESLMQTSSYAAFDADQVMHLPDMPYPIKYSTVDRRIQEYRSYSDKSEKIDSGFIKDTGVSVEHRYKCYHYNIIHNEPKSNYDVDMTMVLTVKDNERPSLYTFNIGQIVTEDIVKQFCKSVEL